MPALNKVPDEQVVTFRWNGKEFSFTEDVILFNISRQKKIEKTPIEGRDGTIKEILGDGDAEISFSGTLFGENGQHPREKKRQLLEILNSNDPNGIEVISSILNVEHGIYAFVVEGFDMMQEAGGWSYQPFTINATSTATMEMQAIGLS